LQNIISEQKIRTQRILGGLIKEGQSKGEIRKQNDNLKQNSEVTSNDFGKKTLSDIGITRNESSAFQQIASIPDEVFEEAIMQKKEAVNKAVSEQTAGRM